MDQSIFHKLPSKIIPVLVLEDSSKALEVGSAFVESGMPIIEITLRTKSAWDSIEKLKGLSGLTLGVGSVTSSAQLRKAVELGVQFMVSPGFDEKLVEEALLHNVAYLPGISNPSDLIKAERFGLSTVKFFPADILGGVKALKAMSAPFPGFSFIPTGGISDKNLNEYLKEKNIPAVGGSWMISKDAIASGDLNTLRRDISIALQSVTN